MNPNDLPQREKIKAHCAGLLAELGHPYDAFRPVWSGADKAARRAFLKIAGLPEIWNIRDWDGLGRSEKEQIKTRVLAMQEWLNRHLAGVAQ